MAEDKKSFEDLNEEVINKGLCIGCGACAGVCPSKAISISYPYQEPEPIIVNDCNNCGICSAVCPGKDIPLRDLDRKFLGRERTSIADPIGVYQNCYKGWAKNSYIRNSSSSSGGVVSALLIYAFENDIIDAALISGWNEEYPYRARPFVAKSVDDLKKACRWSAEMIPINEPLYDTVINQKLGRIAIVGMPCHIHAIRKLQIHDNPKKIAKSIKFTIGLFCNSTYYFEGIKHLIYEFTDIEDLNEIETIDYRGGGGAGSLMVVTKDKRIHQVATKHDYTWHFLGAGTYKRDRCLMCIDFSAELSDVSCGDIFQPVVPGTKQVIATITRTNVGEDLVRKAGSKGYIEYSDHDPEMVPASGMGWESKKHANMNRLMERKRFGWPVPEHQYPLEIKLTKRKLSFPS